MVISLGALYLSYKGYELKLENLSVFIHQTADDSDPIVTDGVIRLRSNWMVDISNLSDTPTSLLNHSAELQINHQTVSYHSPLLTTADGAPVNFPIKIDQGDTRRFYLTIPIVFPPTVFPEDVHHIIKDIVERCGPKNINELKDYLAYEGKDLHGNNVRPLEVVDSQDHKCGYALGYASELRLGWHLTVIFVTSRGKRFKGTALSR